MRLFRIGLKCVCLMGLLLLANNAQAREATETRIDKLLSSSCNWESKIQLSQAFKEISFQERIQYLSQKKEYVAELNKFESEEWWIRENYVGCSKITAKENRTASPVIRKFTQKPCNSDNTHDLENSLGRLNIIGKPLEEVGRIFEDLGYPPPVLIGADYMFIHDSQRNLPLSLVTLGQKGVDEWFIKLPFDKNLRALTPEVSCRHETLYI